MQINGPAHVHGTQPINAPHRSGPAQQATPANPAQGADQLDISREADDLIQTREVAQSAAHEIQQSRAERLAQIKSEIQAGTYETPDKLDIAVGNLLDELG